MIAAGSLAGIQPGAFFCAEQDGGARAICLVTTADSEIVQARSITLQFELQFDVNSGTEINCSSDPFIVVSTREPPEDIREALHAIDRKYRLMEAPEGTKLLEPEVRALLFYASR